MLDTIPITVWICDPYKAYARELSIARYFKRTGQKPAIEQYLYLMDPNLIVDSLIASSIHEIIHWQLDLSGEDYTNERKVILAEEKCVEWVFKPDYRFGIIKKILENW
jgi:hypothetical protein